jgi:hypothetical protein
VFAPSDVSDGLAAGNNIHRTFWLMGRLLLPS